MTAWDKLASYDKKLAGTIIPTPVHYKKSLFGRSKNPDLADATDNQTLQFHRHHTPAYDIDMTNRLLYCVIVLLWKKAPDEGLTSPNRSFLLKKYSNIQQMVKIDDPVLSKLGMPLPKINSKSIKNFMLSNERKIYRDTQTNIKGWNTSISSDIMAASPQLTLPVNVVPAYDENTETECRVGLKRRRGREDIRNTPLSKHTHTSHTYTPTSSTIQPNVPQLFPTKQYIVPHLFPKQPPLVPALQPPPQPQTSSFQPALVPHRVPMQANEYILVPVANVSVPAPPRPCGRTTFYKRRKESKEGKLIPDTPIISKCSLCHQCRQGHHTYRRFLYCHITNQSTRFPGRHFPSFHDFKSYIDTTM